MQKDVKKAISIYKKLSGQKNSEATYELAELRSENKNFDAAMEGYE